MIIADGESLLPKLLIEDKKKILHIGSGSAEKKNPDPVSDPNLMRSEKKIYLYIRTYRKDPDPMKK